MSSAKSSHQRVLTNEEEVEEIPHSYGYLWAIVDHVNEYDEKLTNSIVEEKDLRTLVIIGGVNIFLPSD
jgi:hypothetical protein